tara:strand:+ start:8567 stop:9955 length:1389 start_codon:yes stop_codon:yes gene_type:complete
MAKKKILLLSDDLRLHSGVGTVSKEFVRATIKEFDWVQLGGAIKHPDEGKIQDLSQDMANATGVNDAYCKIYPVSGYGNPQVLRQIISIEQPDAILHFTDPRFWYWLYQMEHEIRQDIPLMFYTIWDDLPFPRWNEPFYESCDQLMCISKQTTNIVRNVVREFPKEKWQINYVPHGINETVFFPIQESDADYGNLLNFKDSILKKSEPEFIIFWNNRNIRRKNPGDLILAYNQFVNGLPEEKRDSILLLLHTDKVDDNGTDIPAVIKELCPYNILFTGKKVNEREMNYLYNLADVTVNIASNEGFGLSGAESLMAGTPIINNVTGGLQDQCGFVKDNGELVTEDDFNESWGSNHDKRYIKCGEWAKPVFPSNRSLQGSPATPYIFDDRCKFEHVAERMREWYDMSKGMRDMCGLSGRSFVMKPEVGMSSREMGNRFIKFINMTLDKWTPRDRYSLYKMGEKI